MGGGRDNEFRMLRLQIYHREIYRFTTLFALQLLEYYYLLMGLFC